MKTPILLLLFAFTVVCAKSANNCLNDSYWKQQRIVFSIYGSDCVNCYLGAANAYEKLKDHYPVTFVFGGVPKRVIDTFIKEKIGTISANDTVILDDSIFNFLCPNISSSILLIKNNRVIISMPFKKVEWDSLLALLINNKPTDDSIDITSYAGTSQTGFLLDAKGSMYITNDLNHITYQYDIEKRQVSNKLDFSFLQDSTNWFIEHSVMLNVDEKKANKKRNEAIIAATGSRVIIHQPYILTNQIYLPITFRIEKKMKLEKDSITALMPAQFLVILNNSLAIQKILSFPYQIENTTGLYNMVYKGTAEVNKLWMVTSSMNNDSLIALYNIDKLQPQLANIYNLKYPDYFPKIGLNGHALGYSGFFTTIDKRACYIFNIEPVLHFFQTNETATLSGFDTTNFTDSSPNYWVSLVKETENKLFLFGGYMNGATYIMIYDMHTFELKQKIKLSEKPLNIIDYKDGKLYLNSLGDEKAYIIVKDIKNLIE